MSSQARPGPTFIYWHNGDTAAIALILAVLQLGKIGGKTESVCKMVMITFTVMMQKDEGDKIAGTLEY